VAVGRVVAVAVVVAVPVAVRVAVAVSVKLGVTVNRWVGLRVAVAVCVVVGVGVLVMVRVGVERHGQASAHSLLATMVQKSSQGPSQQVLNVAAQTQFWQLGTEHPDCSPDTQQSLGSGVCVGATPAPAETAHDRTSNAKTVPTRQVCHSGDRAARCTIRSQRVMLSSLMPSSVDRCAYCYRVDAAINMRTS
jgi:hypothetical protein